MLANTVSYTIDNELNNNEERRKVPPRKANT